MRTWVKLYTEINRDPKMLRLSWAERGIWSALLALAGEIDDQDEDGPTGYVGAIDDVALLLRCDDDEFPDAMAAFTERGMIYDEDGALYVTQFSERQSRAPSSRRDAVAQRVKRHRRREARVRNEDVTTLHSESNEDVTSTKRGVTPSESESESDTEADAEAAARVVERPEGDNRADDNSNSIAELFQMVQSAGILASQTMSEQYLAVLDDDAGGDMALLRAAFQEAADTGARPMPKWLRAVVWRCKREGCMPGQWRNNGNGARASPPTPPPPDDQLYNPLDPANVHK